MRLDSSSNVVEAQGLGEVLHYLSIHRYEKAENIIDSLLGQNPDNAEILYLKAYCEYHLNRLDNALEFCTEALKKGFSLEDGNKLLGLIYKDLGDYVKAEQCYLEVLRLNPQNVNALAEYGWIMLQTGHDVKAKKLIDEALRLDPENAVAVQNSFLYFLAKNDKLEQMQALSKYLAVSDNEIRKHLNIGINAYFKGDYREAREQFRQAFLLEPTNNSLLALLETVDREAHILYLPHRLIERVGGPAIVWLVFMVIGLALFYLGQEMLLVAVASFYLALSIYTWLTPLLAKFMIK